MTTFNRLNFLEEPENATIQELCTKARQKLILRKLCPVDDWSRDGFNEMSTHKSEKFLTVLTKMTETQNSLENRINALTENISQPPQETASQNTDQNFNSQQKWRGDLRGRFYQNRGNRGIILIKDRLLPEPQSKSRNIWNNFRGTFRGRNDFRRQNYRGINRGNYSNHDSRNQNFRQYDNQNAEMTLNTGNVEGHIETTAFSQKVFCSSGYPNHTSRICEARGRSSSRGGQILFNSQSKN